MSSVFEYAKYFIKQNLDNNRQTFDGNMKLQTLLTFANLISLAEYDKPLFDDDILALENGCVIEDVYFCYENDCAGFVADSQSFDPNFSREECDVLNITTALLGSVPAQELSEISHTFDFWKNTFEKSVQTNDNHAAVVSIGDMRKEVDRVRDAIYAVRVSQQ